MRLILILLLGVLAAPVLAQDLDAPLRFDAGPAASTVTPDALPLAPSHGYTTERRYGWTTPPDSGFVRADLARSRRMVNIDGVAGAAMALQVDIPPGRWHVTLWIEAGLEDSSTITLDLEGLHRVAGGQVFLPPAEPRTALQKIYRVYQEHVDIDANGLQLRLTGGRDRVRLLGLSLIPNPEATTHTHQALWRRLEAVGRYPAAGPLDSLGTGLDGLLADLNRQRTTDPGDAFTAYWHQQVGLLAHAERLIREWATQQTGLGLFDRFHQAVMLLDGLLDAADPERFPLYERARWQRGRLLYWLHLERRGPHEAAQARRDLAALYERYPDDPILAMYNGARVEQPDPCDALAPTPGAPVWSNLQREARCRLGMIARWWVEERQAPNGEMGGKLGDDVELLRAWSPLILTGDTVVLRGWTRLADGVWQSRYIRDGYAAQISDVEHASEFIADTAPELVLFRDEPRYLDRLRPSARHFETLWTGVTPSGRRLFRSAWFSAAAVDTIPPKNRDVEMNTRAMKAVRYYAWKSGDPHVIDLLEDWGRAWVHAAGRTDKGKPPGILPASIRFPNEAINGDEPTWYRANMYWDYYDWSHSAGAKMLDQLLFTYTLTGNDTLLQPLHAALDLIRTHTDAGTNGRAETIPSGSPAWAAAQLRENAFFWAVVAQWRFFTGDTRHDDLLRIHGTPYVRYRLTGDAQSLVDELTRVLDDLRVNTPLRTTEVLHTDRVRLPGGAALRAMWTGNGIPEGASPYEAVSWEATDATFTALVTEAGPDRLGVTVFSHAADERPVTLRLWQLAPGRYRLTQHVGTTAPSTTTLAVTKRGQRLVLTLPPQRLLALDLDRLPE